jgi:uridine kinase
VRRLRATLSGVSEQRGLVPDLAARIDRVCSAGHALIAVDGPGGAGKSTLAEQLSSHLDGAVIVPTDDFAAWHDPLDWWPRMLAEVIEPLSKGLPARYQRREFSTGVLLDWIAVPPARITIIEGVSSSRREWAARLCFSVWVDTPRAERLRRGLARDGADAQVLWDEWMATEDAFFAVDQPWERADAVVPGARSTA